MIILRLGFILESLDEQGGMDELPEHQQQMEHAKGRQEAANPGGVEHCRCDGRKIRHDQAPDPRPRQQDEQQAGIHEVAHVEDDEEEAPDLHPAIIS